MEALTSKDKIVLEAVWHSRLNIDSIVGVTLNYFMVTVLYLKKLSAVFMLLLFLGLSVFSYEGALLCLGEDGHIAIEFVNECNRSDFGSQLAGAEDDACGPCKDVKFQSSPAYTNRTLQYTDTQTHTLGSLSRITPSLSLEEHYNNPISLPEKPHYKTLASLKSVVLLI